MTLVPACHECSEKREAEFAAAEERKQHAERMESWRRRCEPEFRQYDEMHPDVDQVVLRAVVNWQPGPKGIGLVGDGNAGKTRMMWALLRRLHLLGISWKKITATELARLYGDSFEERARAKAEEDRLCRVEVLCIDDIGKERSGLSCDAIAERFFHVLDRRYSRRLPVFWTSNLVNPESWEKRLGERGEFILRRLNDLSVTYEVKRGRRQAQGPRPNPTPGLRNRETLDQLTGQRERRFLGQ